METSAIFHRPESEYAYLYKKDEMHIRIRTKRGDVSKVNIISGDPYLHGEKKWYMDNMPLELILSTDVHDYWFIKTGAEFRRLSYAFHVIGNDGTEVLYGDRGIFPFDETALSDANSFFRMPYFQEIDRFKAPDWVKKTIWYQIFPERFANGDTSNDPEGTLPWGSKKHPTRDDFYGGDLQGVIDNLDYLVDLGINGIYFCPIFKVTSNHKYDTTDYYAFDPDFRDNETFNKLVDEAHKRGIRIMLDAVFNHLGMLSYQWADVVENEEKSKFADWFHIHEFPVKIDENLTTEELEDVGQVPYDTFAFTGHMPKLNTANPAVQDYLLEVAAYWIREFDIDAWRLDVANEVDHHFWKRFYQVTTDLKEDFYILGEIWHSSQSWLQGDEFHAVMNYAFTGTIEDYFMKKRITASKMVSGLNEQLMLYRQQANEVMFNSLDSHDTARILTISAGNKDVVKSSLAFTFMQNGSPCIYYGTEVGMDGFDDPDCRKCMVWDEEDQDLVMLAFTKELIAFRKEYQEVVSFGKLDWFDVRDDDNVIGFKRSLGEDTLIAYFNQGEEDLELTIDNQSMTVLAHLTSDENECLKVKKNGFVVFKENNKEE